MRCEQVRRELHETPRPEEPLSPELEAHLDTCSQCQSVHLELVALRRGLTGLEPPPLPEGFELALRQRLIASGPRAVQAPVASRRRRYLGPIALAASVLLAVGAVTGWLVSRQSSSELSESDGRHYHSLKLSVRSAADHPEALFDVRLPAGVALTRAAARSLGQGTLVQWRSRLHAGRNEIELPLVARKPGPVRIEIRVGGRSLATTVQLAAQASRGGRPIVVAWTLDGSEPREVVQ